MKELKTRKNSWFTRFAKKTSHVAGQPMAFGSALLVILAWGVTGPMFGFSDTWQLVINTGTTIITFLMVFVIQSSQNRDTEAIQIKLDELIRNMKGAHNELLDLEELDEGRLDQIRNDYEALASQARKDIRKGKKDTGVPKVVRHATR